MVKANASILSLACLLLAGGVAQAADSKIPEPDLVRRECSTCHGAQGIGASPMFPNLAAQTQQYLQAQLKAFRDHSRADPHAQAFMWGMAAQLPDSEIDTIAKYFSQQPPAAGVAGNPAEIAAGKDIFDHGVPSQGVPACSACHGDQAQGKEVFPRLAGQSRSYLEKQLEAFASNLRENDIMHENARHLTARQISDVTAYLSSL
jgi:cytochrome c553